VIAPHSVAAILATGFVELFISHGHRVAVGMKQLVWSSDDPYVALSKTGDRHE
jgi:hypothetical protein